MDMYPALSQVSSYVVFTCAKCYHSRADFNSYLPHYVACVAEGI